MADLDRRSTLLASYENAAVIVSAIDFERLGDPTPCPRYDVARLIDHLVEAGHRAAALGRGQAPPPGDESPRVELSEAPAQLRRAAMEAAEAWADEAALSSRFTMPWGDEYSGAILVDMYLAELAAHAWDLARATGQLDKLDPSLALAGTRWCAGHDQTPVSQHGRARSPFRGGGAAASRRRRLGTSRRLHGTRPQSIARPVRVAGERAGWPLPSTREYRFVTGKRPLRTPTPPRRGDMPEQGFP